MCLTRPVEWVRVGRNEREPGCRVHRKKLRIRLRAVRESGAQGALASVPVVHCGSRAIRRAGLQQEAGPSGIGMSRGRTGQVPRAERPARYVIQRAPP